MSGLAQAVTDYLTLRRALGFALRDHGLLLADFVEFADQAGASTVTTELALAWATKPVGVAPLRWKARLSVVRGFARWLHALDASVEVPAADLLPYRPERSTPYLYSQADIASLLQATATLSPQLRAATHRTLFGLLAVTGMRIGEAIGLDRDDVDLDLGLVVVKPAKLGEARELPLHSTTVDALAGYARQRDRLCPRPKAPSFFVSTVGTRLIGTCVRGVFARLVRHVGLGPQPGERGPRIHDLRHSFAVTTLRDWYATDVDVAARLPLLSAYLGHASPASTYWYLQAAPELMVLAARRLERLTQAQR